MPPCSLEREVIGATAFYRIAGSFDGASAWELSARLGSEPLSEAVVDFSQCTDFVDHGIAVIASAIGSAPRRIELRGLRQHHERLFRYFGVDPAKPGRMEKPISSVLSPPIAGAKEVA